MGGGAREVVTKNENLQTMVTLDDSRVDQLIQCAWKETFEKGTQKSLLIWGFFSFWGISAIYII